MKCLTEDQLSSYDTDGYIVLDLLTEQEVDELSQTYNDIFTRKQNNNLEATWGGNWSEKSQQQNQVESIHGLHMHSAVFTRFLLHPKVLDACEDILRSGNILLHHTKAHRKPPGKGSPFPMHQDYHYFPYKDNSMIAVFLSLDASDPSNGGLCVYPGSHNLGPQKDVSDNPRYHYLDNKLFPIESATPLSLKKGQIVIFSYLLIHGSYPNTSDRVRRMLLTQLVTAEDVPLKDMHRSAAQGLVLRGSNVLRNADITKRSTGE